MQKIICSSLAPFTVTVLYVIIVNHTSSWKNVLVYRMYDVVSITNMLFTDNRLVHIPLCM